jgi:hypothetical protein
MKHREVAISDSSWAADREFMLNQVRAEIASATSGQQERYRVLVENDTQLEGALTQFGQASKLMSQAMESTGRGRP